MEKINLVELLKDCPEGMELDCTMYEDVCFYEITDDPVFPVRIKRIDGAAITLTKYGGYADSPSAKCVIFPKGKTTWEGFVPSCRFKDGDILYIYSANPWICIYKEGGEEENVYYNYVAITTSSFVYYDCSSLCHRNNVKEIRHATEEEKTKLFNAIKASGYKWNSETKTLEELIKPKFKVGDRVRHKSHTREGNIVTEIKDAHYILDDELALPFTSQDEYELVLNKFDVNTLKPFESKVLVRNDKNQYWIPAFWGCKRTDGYTTTFGWCKYCIPFEGNEHLLESNKECDEFYRTWEKIGD